MAETHSEDQSLLDALENEPDLRYELTFYSTFSHKTFLLMQREGPGAEGYPKLQQSFREAVEKVRDILRKSGEYGFGRAEEFLELSPAGMAKLMDLMRDLARMNDHERRIKESKI